MFTAFASPVSNPRHQKNLSLFRFVLHGALAFGFLTAPLLRADTFTNPITKGADPWIIQHKGKYMWCKSRNDLGITLRVFDELDKPGKPREIWTAPAEGPYSKEVWAPEIHFIDEHWYVYFAASDGDNKNHLAYVLKSEGDDPFGKYKLHGPLATGEGTDGKSPNIWAIDMTVLNHKGQLYALWSGWEKNGADEQFLYIAPMKTPVELSEKRVRICDNDDYLWERTEEKVDSRGLNEGPQILQNGDRTFVIYSCAASWLPTYKLGLLELIGDDPMKPESWKKHPEPIFQSSEETYGVGHGCFVKSPDGSEWWHVYHAKNERKDGWNRSIFAQPFTFDASGFPQFGKPVNRGIEIQKPAR